MKKIYLLISFFCSAFVPVYAYELVTHGLLTERAYERSALLADPNRLREIGIDVANANVLGENYYDIGSDGRVRERRQNDFERTRMPNAGKDFLAVKGWLMRGAIREDDNVSGPNPRFGDIDTPFTNRVFNHFYDPQFNNPLRVGLDLGIESPVWGRGAYPPFTTPFIPPVKLADNHYTVRDAREAMYRALTGKRKDGADEATAAGKEGRDKYWATTFRALGNIVHLVQDMAQPQHTRNDAHSGIPGFGHTSVYEKYIEASATGAIFRAKDAGVLTRLEVTPIDWSILLGDGSYPIPRFTDYVSFWTTRHRGEAVEARQGLADYSNRGFYSAGTNINSEYPSPFPTNRITGGALIPYPWDGEPSTEETPVAQVLVGNVSDALPGGTSATGVTLTSFSLFDQFLQNEGKQPSHALTRVNYDDQAKLLLPRAVAYSAGLIDYFFRGRLEGEDVELTDTGIRLKVKNAIDVVETPAWASEVLNSSGVLVVAFEYKDSDGVTRYGVSDSVSLTDNLAPGQISQNTYSFKFSIPTGATEIKYRLVFRGKLGQEEDAVAVGLVEGGAGFVITPNYLPADGKVTPRLIAKQGGEWKLSARTDIVAAGNVDWKGKYKGEQATRVLSWYGPRSRYFKDTVRFEPHIYRDGEVFAVAPGRVLGAAVATDRLGNEWLLAVAFKDSETLYRRPFAKSNSAALYDPVTAPDGWQLIATFERLPAAGSIDSPWFFNGSGTEAQTMRRLENFSRIDGIPNIEYLGLARLKIEVDIETPSAVLHNLGNFDGISVREEVSIKPDPQANCGTRNPRPDATYPAYEVNNVSRSGRYVIAVDYRHDTEVLAILSDTRSRQFDVRIDGERCKSRHAVQTINATGERSLEIDGQSVVLNRDHWQESSEETRTPLAPWFDWHIFTGQIESSVVTEYVRTDLYHLDLRYRFVVWEEAISGAITAISGDFGNGQSASSTKTMSRSRRHEVRSDVLDKVIWSNEQSALTSSGYGFEDMIIDSDHERNWVKTSLEKPDPARLILTLRNAWAVDGAGNVIASHAYTVQPDLFLQQTQTRLFNYLTGVDDLTNLVPTAPEWATYYPIGVVK